jgi:PKD repeat protein
MNKIALVFVFLICFSTLPIDTSQATEPDDNFTVTGKVLYHSGEIAGSTSIKITGYDSVWTDSAGDYQYAGIAGGEHTIRAYFMNDGHNVAYRKIIINSDLQLDWIVDHNWITVSSDDQLATFSISGENIQENKSHAELLEFGLHEME